jgi:6-phosphogluconolactonase
MDRHDNTCLVRSLVAISLSCVLGIASAAAAPPEQAPPAAIRVYVGTYTEGGKSKGIYRFRLDTSSGALSPEGEPAESANPSFLAIHPSGRFLYAVNEVGDFRGKDGAVSAFVVDGKTGALTLLNQEASQGSGPCYITVDKEGRHVLVANYGGGTVAVLPVQADGRLAPASSSQKHEGHGVNPRRQTRPHAHSINLDAANRFAFAADLGLDKLLVYRYDAAKGTLAPDQPVSVAPGAGPRHFTFHPDGRHAYVINEMYSTVTAFDYNAEKGALAEIQTVGTLPKDFEDENSTAEVVVRPDGKFLYGSNRGHDSIAIFAIDAASGKLTAAGHQPTLGKEPRNFAIDPSGSFLLAANQNSDTLVVFRIDGASGHLTPVGAPVSVPRPVCVRMIRIGG